MRLKWFVLVALMGLVPSPGTAQQTKPPGATRPNGGDRQTIPEGLAAPLPPEGQFQPAPLPAGEPRPAAGLTLADLEERAESCNPTLAQAAARVQAARAQCLQAGLYPNPVIGYLGSEIGNEGRAGQQGGFIGQEVVTAGKLRLNRAVAGQEIRQAEYAWEAQRFRVLTDVRRGFYDVLVAQRTVELAEQLVGIGERGVKAAEELLKAEEVARADLLQARIEADSARILLDKARSRHTAAWRNLAAVVGDRALQPTALAGSLRVPRRVWLVPRQP